MEMRVFRWILGRPWQASPLDSGGGLFYGSLFGLWYTPVTVDDGNPATPYVYRYLCVCSRVQCGIVWYNHHGPSDSEL